MTDAAEQRLITSGNATGFATRPAGRAIRNGCVSLVLILLILLGVVRAVLSIDDRGDWDVLARASLHAIGAGTLLGIAGLAGALLVHRRLPRIGLGLVLIIVLVTIYPAAMHWHGRPWVWFPFILLVGLAALDAIPVAVREAAAVDRAGEWFTFRTITWPLVAGPMLLGVACVIANALEPADARATVATCALLITAIVVDGAMAHRGGR